MSRRRNNWPLRAWAAVLLLTVAVAAMGKEKSVEELKAKYQNASKPDEKASLAIEIAESQVDAADQLIRQGKIDEGQKDIADGIDYAGQARDAALVTGHHIKKIEISVRKMAHRLTDMKRQLTYEDQAPVQAAIDQLEKIRTDLLSRMFKGNK